MSPLIRLTKNGEYIIFVNWNFLCCLILAWLKRVSNMMIGLCICLMIGCTQQPPKCYSDWKITGYYTPVEREYKGSEQRTVLVKNYGNVSLNRNFVRAVKLEGWGKSRFGWYLGYYGGNWHKRDQPLNAQGAPLKVGDIAVDNRLIPKETVITIPAIKSIMGVDSFVATDVGSQIKKQRVDVYTGEGKKAQKKTHLITGYHRVCKG